jgi:hypothetical protein
MDYQEKPEPRCRTCSHGRGFHYPDYGGPMTFPLPCKYETTYRRCKCIEYLPTDNLEFLEYCEQKQKV